MKRKWLAVLLAGALTMSGSTMSLAMEREGIMSEVFIEPENNVKNQVMESENISVNGIEGEKTGEGIETLQDGKTGELGFLSGTYEDGLTWSLIDGVLTISGNGVVNYNADISSNSGSITTLVIEEGVTGIGDNAFAYMSNLVSADIPKSVTKIGSFAFQGSGLEKIVIPDSVGEIGELAFSNCHSKELVISNGVREIGKSAFAWNDFSEVIIPNSVTAIKGGAFAWNENLAKAILPDGIREISCSLFMGCRNLEKIDIPKGVTKIEYWAFANCENLLTVSIPGTVKTIEYAAFVNCNGLKAVEFQGDAPEIRGEGITQTEIIGVEPFQNVVAIANHPENNQTWTTQHERALGSNLVWAVPKTDPLQIVPEATDNVYVIGSSGGATITCTGALKDFVSVYVDDAEVDRNNYTLAEGSTILTFTTKYLDTLSVGKHKVTLNYTYGSVDTELTVLDKSNTASDADTPGGKDDGNKTNVGTGNGAGGLGSARSPRTGDESSALLWLAAAMLAGTVALATAKKRHFI